MLFNSNIFLFAFLPVVLLVFFALSARRSLALAWLVVASLFFYGWWNPSYLILLGISIVVGFGRTIGRFRLGSLAVEVRMIPIEGFVIPAPRTLDHVRLKNALIYFAGTARRTGGSCRTRSLQPAWCGRSAASILLGIR